MARYEPLDQPVEAVLVLQIRSVIRRLDGALYISVFCDDSIEHELVDPGDIAVGDYLVSIPNEPAPRLISAQAFGARWRVPTP